MSNALEGSAQHARHYIDYLALRLEAGLDALRPDGKDAKYLSGSWTGPWMHTMLDTATLGAAEHAVHCGRHWTLHRLLDRT